MAGPILLREKFLRKPGGLQRTAGTQILSIRSFIASFDVAFHNTTLETPFTVRPRVAFFYQEGRLSKAFAENFDDVVV